MCIQNEKTKCMAVAISSTIFHTILLCISLTNLVLKITKPGEDSAFAKPLIIRNGYGKPQYSTFYALDGTLIAFGVLGVIMSVLLMIGLKRKRHGCVVVFLFYAVLASILLLLTGIILYINGYWRVALVITIVSVLGFWSLEVVYRNYEDLITQHSSFTRHNSISNVTLLTEDFNDITDDANQNQP